MPDTAIAVKDLAVHFPITRGVFGKIVGYVKAVDGVSFEVIRGEVYALVGESGCGKTTTAQAILGLVPPTRGEVRLSPEPSLKPVGWSSLPADKRRDLRRRIQVVFQDPLSSLNPRMTVRATLEEPLIIHRLGTKPERDRKVDTLVDQVGLSRDFLDRYPHEFSGGQRQRIGIARALATGPSVLIADEPVSALDVSIQAQIINLMQSLKEQHNLTMVFISHDLAVVRHLSDRIAVLYNGMIMESGTNDHIFSSPLHPYTHLLLSSVPEPGSGRTRAPEEARYDDSEKSQQNGCPFYPRCPRRTGECREQAPPLEEHEPGHLVACRHV